MTFVHRAMLELYYVILVLLILLTRAGYTPPWNIVEDCGEMQERNKNNSVPSEKYTERLTFTVAVVSFVGTFF